MAKSRNDAAGGGETPSTAETRAAKPPAIPDRAIYLGPTFAKNGVLFRYGQIFNNGVPVAWLEQVAAEPEFRLLLPPIEKAAKARVDLQNPGSAIAMASKKIAATAAAAGAHKARRGE